MNPKKIAITGNFGAGKSTVGGILNSLGYVVIDTDKIVHDLLSEKSDLTNELVSIFGKRIINTESTYFINKKELANIVFKNTEEKATLEKIIHPKVREKTNSFIEDNKDKNKVFVLIPLLFETHQENNYDEIWCVTCEEKTQTERLLKRGFSIEEINSRLLSQISQEIKIKKSHFIIDNSKDTNHTKEIILKKLDST